MNWSTPGAAARSISPRIPPSPLLVMVLALALAAPASAGWNPATWWITKKTGQVLSDTGRAIDETARGTLILTGQAVEAARPTVVRTIRDTRVAVDETLTGAGIIAGDTVRRVDRALPAPVRQGIRDGYTAVDETVRGTAILTNQGIQYVDRQTKPLQRAVDETVRGTGILIQEGATDAYNTLPQGVRTPIEETVTGTGILARQGIETTADWMRDLIHRGVVTPTSVDLRVPSYGVATNDVTGLGPDAARILPADGDGLIYAASQKQAEHARQIREAQGEYPAVFPELYAPTTEAILAAADNGMFERPDLIRQEVAMFDELWVRNANAWANGEKVEPHWQTYFEAARDLEQIAPGNGTFDGRLAAFTLGARAHITGDLPRALLEVYNNEVANGADPDKLMATMQRDFLKGNEVFGGITDRYLSDREKAGSVTSGLWGLLPEGAQETIAGGRTPIGFRPAMEAARNEAFERFQEYARRGLTGRGPDGRPLPDAEDFTPLEDFPRQQLRPNRPQGFLDGFKEGIDPQASTGEFLPMGDSFGQPADPGVGGLAGNFDAGYGDSMDFDTGAGFATTSDPGGYASTSDPGFDAGSFDPGPSMNDFSAPTSEPAVENLG